MNKDALLTLLKTLGIHYELFEHEAVMTVAEASRLHDTIPGMHCKCLFLKSKDGRYWLAAFPAEMRVDLKSLHKELGCPRLSFADADTLLELLGVTPGSVTLFAAVNDTERKVTIVMEKSLTETALFCFHPLVNTATVTICPDAMRKVFAYTGHEPVIVSG